MNANGPPWYERVSLPFQTRAGTPQIDLRYLIGVMLWRRWQIVWTVVAALLLAGVYLAMREPVYEARSHIMVHNNKFVIGRDDAVFSESQLDPTFLATQIEIIRSNTVADLVVRRLGWHLEGGTAEGSDGNALSAEKTGTTLTPPPIENTVEGEYRYREAFKRFQRNFHVDRVGLSYVVEVLYKANDPKVAAQVANEAVAVFSTLQVKARDRAARSSSAWLISRAKKLGPQTEIVSPAMEPMYPSSPRALLILALAGFAGGALATAIAFAREFLDQGLRSPEQLTSAIGVDFLGVVPQKTDSLLKRVSGIGPNLAVMTTEEQISLLSNGVETPLSPFWNTLHSSYVALQAASIPGRACRLGVTSLFAGDGKTTVAANLARFIAETQSRVLLVDANLSESSLSELLCPEQELGIIDLLKDKDADFDAYAWDIDGLHVLPLGGSKHRLRRGHILWSGALNNMIRKCGERYDFIIFDLPALTPEASVRAATEYLDHLLLVVDWPGTSTQEMQLRLSASPAIRSKLIGAIFNRVDVHDFGRLPSPFAQLYARTLKRSGRIAPDQEPS